MTPEDFYSSLVTFNIQLSDTQKAQFKTYFEFLVSEK
jgi:16S rRNA (guanine527-N7)-methyltransferase